MGGGTTADTIFELKSVGAFKGAKRKLRFPREERLKPLSKCQKLNLVEQILHDFKFTNSSTPEKTYKRAEVAVKISDSKGGWYGNKKSPKKLGENILKTPASRRKTIMDPEKGENSPNQSKTPSNTIKKKRNISGAPSRGQGSILGFLSSRKNQMATGGGEKGDQLYDSGEVGV